jgi:hypothetical protein
MLRATPPPNSGGQLNLAFATPWFDWESTLHPQVEPSAVAKSALARDTLTAIRIDETSARNGSIARANPGRDHPGRSQKLASDVFRYRFHVPKNVCRNRSVFGASHSKAGANE